MALSSQIALQPVFTGNFGIFTTLSLLFFQAEMALPANISGRGAGSITVKGV
jgi:hypothetical protein